MEMACFSDPRQTQKPEHFGWCALVPLENERRGTGKPLDVMRSGAMGWDLDQKLWSPWPRSRSHRAGQGHLMVETTP